MWTIIPPQHHILTYKHLKGKKLMDIFPINTKVNTIFPQLRDKMLLSIMHSSPNNSLQRCNIITCIFRQQLVNTLHEIIQQQPSKQEENKSKRNWNYNIHSFLNKWPYLGNLMSHNNNWMSNLKPRVQQHNTSRLNQLTVTSPKSLRSKPTNQGINSNS